MLIQLEAEAEGDGGVGEEGAVIFKLGVGASSHQMDEVAGPAVVALAEVGGMVGASTQGDSHYRLMTPPVCPLGLRLSSPLLPPLLLLPRRLPPRHLRRAPLLSPPPP